MIKTHRRGFTLIELLVVISIVAVLSTLAAVMAPKILKKSAQTKTVQSMQRMASSLRLYANDHANRIPPPMTPASENEEKDDIYWFTYLEEQTSGKTLDELLKDGYWKQTKSSDFVNPTIPKKDLKHDSVGYAMNGALATNIALNRGEDLDPELALTTPVNLLTVRNPERTPIIRPHWTWSYKGDKAEASDKKLLPYLAGGTLPVLYLDGHVETMTPVAYTTKGLHEVPKVEKDN
ncbi:type II secretion system protein [Luteolibacter sp. SL250]|uniref:type II secretion system protein n=1 Tax=Luteolibacter sp. SL250 TaxID=2995170 RepID=UPI002271C4B7|nr:type II secretion system protein [Luteolibacter sp. SL250]WAC20481.1 type II secretion system protein [Luteolibacter sp. SL250]